MPARCLAGLLPSALLDQYHFWQQPGGDLIGEAIDDVSADHEIYVRMVPRAKVMCTGAEGVCARITRRRVKVSSVDRDADSDDKVEEPVGDEGD